MITMQSRRFLKGVGNFRVSLAAVAVCADAFSLGAAEVLQDSSGNSPDKVYVSSSGSNTSPYNTWETAAHNIKDAIDAVNGENADAPGIVYLAPGTYTASSGCSADGNYLVSVEKSVRLVGTGDKPDETVLDGEGARRVLSLTGQGAGAQNIMIARSHPFSPAIGSELGFGLNMVNAGIVDNCIISNASVSLSVNADLEHWVYLNGGTITNSVISDGNVTHSSRCRKAGGTILVVKGSIGTTKIYRNTSCNQNGGVVTVKGADSSLVDCDIYNNKDSMREWGVCCGIVAARRSAQIINCRIFNNDIGRHYTSCYYAALGVNAASIESPNGNQYYTFNSSYGGVLIDRCVISNNTAKIADLAKPSNGVKVGALGVLLGYKTTLRNSLIVNNKLTPFNSTMSYDYPISGGVRSSDTVANSTDSIIENCTIVGNQSVGNPSQSGVHLLAGSIINSIACDNGAQRPKASWVDGNISLANDATATYCLTKGKDEVGDAVVGEGNLAGDPLFNADYTLSRTSPAVNAGLNQDWMKGETDLSGKKRISGGKVDLGCYERFMQGFSISIR